MTLYYEGEKVVDENEEGKKAEEDCPVRDEADPGRDDCDTGRDGADTVREVSPKAFFFLNMMYPGRYREGPVRDNYEPGRCQGEIEGESRTTVKLGRNNNDSAQTAYLA